jgi:hypothetical protein
MKHQKSVLFADGLPLSIQRFDDRWISATDRGVSYEFDRGSRNLTFAGTIMKQGTATIIIGAGKCTVESDARSLPDCFLVHGRPVQTMSVAFGTPAARPWRAVRRGLCAARLEPDYPAARETSRRAPRCAAALWVLSKRFGGHPGMRCPAPTGSRGQGVVQETSAPFRPNCPSDKNFLGLDAPGPALAAELDG